MASAPPTTLHGALVDVEGMGVLLLGRSGIGKSECALELVRRGHRLVADDVVVLERDGEGRLFGESPELIRHHMELRGIGIVYLPDLFGPEAVGERAEIGLVCRLAEWRPGLEVERVGLERPLETVRCGRLQRIPDVSVAADAARKRPCDDRDRKRCERYQRQTDCLDDDDSEYHRSLPDPTGRILSSTSLISL